MDPVLQKSLMKISHRIHNRPSVAAYGGIMMPIPIDTPSIGQLATPGPTAPDRDSALCDKCSLRDRYNACIWVFLFYSCRLYCN